MPLYKQVLLTNLKSTPKDVVGIFQECAQIIVGNGGVIRGVENRGVRRLGYAIEDRRWGEMERHYEGKLIVSQFNTSPAVLSEVEKKLKNSFPIIRFQSFKIRDPLDSLMNTRQSLETLQQALNPTMKKDADFKKKQEKKSIGDTGLDDLLANDDDDDDLLQFRRYVPEWKRDALFEPLLPDEQ
jgi:ribosomal protein S6